MSASPSAVLALLRLNFEPDHILATVILTDASKPTWSTAPRPVINPLAVDRQQGVTLERVHEIVAALMHRH